MRRRRGRVQHNVYEELVAPTGMRSMQEADSPEDRDTKTKL